MVHLAKEQLRRLSEHKYSCSNTSLMDPLMQKWWCWLVLQCPMTLAPNLITITGLAINIATCLILIYFSPDARQEVPGWACFLCAFGLFVYQSLDAIDGKQARRTGTSSPIGELFDHGCDSLSTIFVSLSVCCAVQLGSHPYWMLFQCMMAVILFYCAHWQTYVSGTLRFGFIDVTEAQFGVILILMASTVFGSSFWSQKIPTVGLALKCLPTLTGVTAGAVALFSNFKIILVKRGAGRNGSTVAGTSVLSPIVPLFLMIAPAVLVVWKSPDGIFLHNPALYLLTFGFVSARVTNRLVLAHMTKSEMAYTDASMLGPAALFLNQYFNCPLSEHILLWIVCVYVVYDLIKYCREICLEICDYLGIRLFKITPTVSVQHSNSRSSGIEKNGSSSKYVTRSKSRVKAN